MKNKDIKKIVPERICGVLHFEGGKNPSIHIDGISRICEEG